MPTPLAYIAVPQRWYRYNLPKGEERPTHSVTREKFTRFPSLNEACASRFAMSAESWQGAGARSRSSTSANLGEISISSK